MTTWTNEELNRIGTAEELDISPFRQDGTLQKPRTIWVVRVGDDLYVRSYRGRSGDWYRGTRLCHKSRIQAGGIEKDVSLVDDAYRTKYARYPQYVAPMLTPEARTTTMKLVPLK
jgi:hypothetical protein